jgi:hypothetical protein
MFDHVEIHVSDLPASRAFYGEALGLPTFEGELVEWGEAVHHDGSRAGEIDHLWLRMSDVAAAKRFDGPPRSTTSGDASAVSCTPTPPAMRSPAIASARCVGTCGSSVRMRPFSRITVAQIVRCSTRSTPTSPSGSGNGDWGGAVEHFADLGREAAGAEGLLEERRVRIE